MIKQGLIIFAFIGLFNSKGDGGWKLSLEKDFVNVYVRSVENSSFNEFRAETTMKGSIERFREIITDFAGYSDWMADCKYAELIYADSPDKKTYYLKIKMPVPFANRDIVKHLTISEGEDSIDIEITCCQADFPEKDGVVRMKEARGSWHAHQISDTEIFVSYQHFADPGGDVPAWMLNTFIVRSPYQSLVNLREVMASKKEAKTVIPVSMQ